MAIDVVHGPGLELAEGAAGVGGDVEPFGDRFGDFCEGRGEDVGRCKGEGNGGEEEGMDDG